MAASIEVTRLPEDAGPAGWNLLLPEPPPARVLEGDVNADYLVVGAGFAGLSAARRLRQLEPTAGIVVVDAHRVGDGPAGRNSGFMIDLPHDLTSSDYSGQVDGDVAQIRANRAAIDFAREAARDYRLDADAFSQPGKVNAAATEGGLRHNQAYAAHLASLGEPHRLLDADEMHALTGSRYYLGGLYAPGTAMIQPAAYVRGLAAGLGEDGVELYENSAVTRLERNGGRWRAGTAGGSVSARKVVLAVNGHAESFGFFRGRLIHITLYASLSRALTVDEVARLGGESTWGLTPADPLGTTVRRVSGAGGDRILVRNRATFTPNQSAPTARLATIPAQHRRTFDRRFPQLAGVEMDYCWSGRLCLSWNNVSAFGELEDGLYSACCQNGLGTTRGTLAGMLAAELATGNESALLSQVQREPPPRRLPPAPLVHVGARASILWGELKAGAEL